MCARKKNEKIVAIDLGSHFVRTAIAVVDPDDGIRVMGTGIQASMGMRQGRIVNLEDSGEAVLKSIRKAEEDAGIKVNKANISINGIGLKVVNSTGVQPLGTNPVTISKEHMNQCISAARNISLSPSFTPLHYMIKRWILEDDKDVDNPLQMESSKLEVELHIVTVALSQKTNFIKAVNYSNVSVDSIQLQTYASARSALSDEEQELGVLLVNIGASCTSGAVFKHKKIMHTFSIPIGGNLFTKDIIAGLRTSIYEAERVKRAYGLEDFEKGFSDEKIEIEASGNKKTKLIERSVLTHIIRSRADDVFGLIKEELSKQAIDATTLSTAVFTGGSVLMKGIISYAEKSLDIPSRIGIPLISNFWPEELLTPEFTVLHGLILGGYYRVMGKSDIYREENNVAKKKVLSKGKRIIRNWFKDFMNY